MLIFNFITAYQIHGMIRSSCQFWSYIPVVLSLVLFLFFLSIFLDFIYLSESNSYLWGLDIIKKGDSYLSWQKRPIIRTSIWVFIMAQDIYLSKLEDKSYQIKRWFESVHFDDEQKNFAEPDGRMKKRKYRRATLVEEDCNYMTT